MKTIAQKLFRLGALLVVLVGLGGIGPLSEKGMTPVRPVPASAAAPTTVLPATTCTLTGATERTCELWAKTGTLTLPDATTVPIWGYTDSAAGLAQLPGPELIVNQEDTVNVVLHNNLAVTTTLAFPGQGLVPDLTGVAPNGTITHTFTAAVPGTFSYEAGLTTNGARQVAMGLFGALIVRPTAHPDWAYGDAATAFNDETLLIFSEIDPLFNADPANFDMVDYAPEYWLINGKAYPDTDPIATAAGHKVLLRLLNAGLNHHSIGLMGLYQTVLAVDGNPLPHSYEVVAETIAAGQSLDTLVTIPAGAAPGMEYALYEAAHQIHNAGQLIALGGPTAFGGMLTFLTVPTAPPGPDTVGPLASAVQVTPDLTTGASGVTLSATISDFSTGGASVVAAEYFTDSLGAPGTGAPLTGAFGTTTVPVSTTISAAALAGLPTGEHIFYVHGKDANERWGAPSSAILNLVTDGPVISGMVLTPSPTNGTKDVGIQATGDARPTGPVDVVAAEYFIDTMGADGSGTAMALNHIAPVASLTATVPQAVVAALSEGPHTVYIHGQDSLGNWGGFGEIVLQVDKTGPTASAVVASPNPNNGTLGIAPSLPYVRLEALFGDPVVGGGNSNIVRAEGFIDTVGADGSGFLLIATDGVFDRPSEMGYVHIPLITVRIQLADGPHTLYVHAKDAAGNWGPVGSVALIVDRTGPVVSGMSVTPNPTNRTTGAVLTATVTDPVNGPAIGANIAPGSNIVAAEWFVGTDPGEGNGTAVAAADGAFDSPSEDLIAAVNVIGWRNGDHTLSVRAKDAAGNWGSVVTTTLTVRGAPPRLIIAAGFEAGNFAAWTASVGAVSISSAAGMGGTTLGMEATVNGTAPAYVVDGTPNYEAIYSARFYFHPNGTDTAGGEHDIFVGLDLNDTPIFGIQYEHVGADSYEVLAWVLHDGAPVFTDWYDISNGPNLLEIGWESGTPTTFSLYIDGELVQTLSGLNTSAYLLDEVRLGPSSGLAVGMRGTEYYDEFIAMRRARVMFDVFLPLMSR